MQLAPQLFCVRLLKRAVCVFLLALGVVSAPGFSLLGPYDNWQVPEIGYNLPGDVGGPMNITEEYRYNTPNLYYAYNQNFIDFFGTNGINAVEQAIAMFNALTNTGFTALDINQYPLEGTRINPRAEQLQLLDLKTITINLLLEQLGLAEPERWVWTIHDRWQTSPASPCPAMSYWVVMRNFDPVGYFPTPYINNVLFTYEIIETCNPPNPLAWTFNFPVEFPLDVFAPENTTLAYTSTVFRRGAYALSLTRDDVGGLKYLYQTNNVNWETIAEGAQQFVTNTTQAQLIFSSNLWAFAQAALTNNAVDLAALYPGLIITGTTNIFTNIWVTNLTAYFTNSTAPWQPVDAFPRLVILTNRTLTVQTHYIHTFANVFTGLKSDGQLKLVQLSQLPTKPQNVRGLIETVAITNAPWLPVTAPFRTNVTVTPVTLRGLQGDFFILPTNACSVQLLGLQATLITSVTNSLVNTTNQFGTNLPPVGGGGGGGGDGTGGNTNGFQLQVPQLTQNLITFESNRVWVAYLVECVSTNVFSLHQGIDKIQFIRTSFDSLIGQYYAPITNVYKYTEVTNSRFVTNIVRREVRQPDFLFTSADLTAERVGPAAARNEPRWQTNGALPGLVGPGTITPGVTFTYNRVGPLILHVYSGTNEVGSGLNQAAGITNFIWGSFDGSTNEPIVYPFGTIFTDLEPMLLFQVLTSELPDGTVGVPYSAQLQGSGGNLPYSWMPHVDSPPLPPGLSLSNDGFITGVPEWEGTYTFSVTLTEAGARATTRPLTITINP
jgi:hypothetical protein